MKNVLVTGAAGFIGSHVVKQLLNAGYNVTGLDNLNDYYDVSLKLARLQETGIDNADTYNCPVQSRSHDHYRFVKLELNDKPNILALFREQRFEYIIHLAAQAGVRYSLSNPDAYIDSNIYGFLNILEGCRFFPVKHLIYASSSSVYGANTEIPFRESDCVDNPISLYAATKKANELFAHTYSHLFSIPCTGLRFFTVYGPWGRPDMAYYLFTKNILEGNPIAVYNNGDMMRDFTFVDDISESIFKLLDCIPNPKDSNLPSCSAKAPCTIFNIGANSPVKLLDFIKEIENATGREAHLEFHPMQPGDVPVTYADVSKLEHATHSYSKISISEGIPRFVEWYLRFHRIKDENIRKESAPAMFSFT